MQKSLDNAELHELEDPDGGNGPDSQDLESEGEQEVVKPPDTTEDSTAGVGEDMKADLGLLVLGGTDEDVVALRQVDLITQSGVCRSHGLPALPAGRHGGVAGLLAGGRTVVVCGGLDRGGQVTAQCWQLAWNSSDWSPAPSLLHPTAFASQVNLQQLYSSIVVSSGLARGEILRHWRSRDQPRRTELSASI